MAKTKLWDYWSEIRSFDTQPPDIKDDILRLMFDSITTHAYQFEWCAADIAEHLDKDLVMKVLDAAMSIPYGSEERANKILSAAYNYVENRDSIRKKLVSSKKDSYKRLILSLDNLTAEEEEAGLRGLAKIKCAPDYVLKKEYCPTLSIIKKLPPVMRLGVFESLLYKPFVKYNIFKNVTDGEEFKTLLFGSVLKHQQRAEKVWTKYQDMIKMGNNTTFSISMDCPACGRVDFKISSKVIHSVEGFDKSRLRYSLRNYGSCSICGMHIGLDNIKIVF